MTLTATMTSKGQVTLPSALRKILGLRFGDRISFSVNDEASQAVMRGITRSVDDVFGVLHRKGDKHLTVADMKKATAERSKKYART